MILQYKKENKDNLIQDQKYIVYAYIEYETYNLYWVLDSEDEFMFLRDEDIELINDIHSKYWKTIINTRTGTTLYLPFEWVKEIPSEYYNDRMDEIDGFWSAIDDLYGSSCGHMSISNDCTYIKEINDEHPEFVENIDDIALDALAIGYNWILCPECDEAFEVNISQNIVTCPNVACELRIYNPYVKWCPLPPSQSIKP